MEETADTVARVSRPSAKGQSCGSPHPQGLLRGGLFDDDSDFKDTQVFQEAEWFRPGEHGGLGIACREREEHILPEA